MSIVVVAGIFNPWDRALYLSVWRDRPFLDARNWKKPYKGFNQAVFHRTLSGGLYFPLYDIYHDPISEILHEHKRSSFMSSALSGYLAGATNGGVSVFTFPNFGYMTDNTLMLND
jgi:hypothetical protein